MKSRDDAFYIWLNEFSKEPEVSKEAKVLLKEILKTKDYESPFVYRIRNGSISNENPCPNHIYDFLTEHSIWINWLETDKVLIAAFREWLKNNRIADDAGRRGKSDEKIYKADLKALDAYRKIRVHGSVPAAMNADMVFENEKSWYQAKARIKKIINDLNRGRHPILGWER